MTERDKIYDRICYAVNSAMYLRIELSCYNDIDATSEVKGVTLFSKLYTPTAVNLRPVNLMLIMSLDSEAAWGQGAGDWHRPI